MITRIRIRDFRQFEALELNLSERVIFVGPNNSGKSSALQAIQCIGLAADALSRNRSESSQPTFVDLNRKDLQPFPVSNTRHLVRAENPPCPSFSIEIDPDSPKAATLHFTPFSAEAVRVTWPRQASPPPLPTVHYLTFSPLVEETEFLKSDGELQALLRSGRTGSVLRNLAFKVETNQPESWLRLRQIVLTHFNVSLMGTAAASEPLQLFYREHGPAFEILSAGSGLRQFLGLALLVMFDAKNSILLLDEPDNHLEVLKQRHLYREISNLAKDHCTQLILATHSEAILDEAVERSHAVIDFAGGKAKTVDLKSDFVRNSLTLIPSHDYYLAAQKGFVLFLEGSTDLDLLRAFATKLNHPASNILAEPVIHYIGNHLKQALSAFQSLSAYSPDLKAFLLLDNTPELSAPPSINGLPLNLTGHRWSRREFENYLTLPEVLLKWAGDNQSAMRQAIERNTIPDMLTDPSDIRWKRQKASDDFLEPILRAYLRATNQPLSNFNKNDYFRFVEFMTPDQIDPEVTQVLDQIAVAAKQPE